MNSNLLNTANRDMVHGSMLFEPTKSTFHSYTPVVEHLELKEIAPVYNGCIVRKI